MKTICSFISNEFIVKNSRFITCLYPLKDSNIDCFLERVKKEYPKATHYCYAYLFDDLKKTSDDGEPSGTAGMPMLHVLETEQLNHVLAITVRYFGGIKLGAGGLVRAYTKSLTETLRLAHFIDLIPGYMISISFDYSQEKQILYLFQNRIILEKKYEEQITYICYVEAGFLPNLTPYSYNILDSLLIEDPSVIE